MSEIECKCCGEKVLLNITQKIKQHKVIHPFILSLGKEQTLSYPYYQKVAITKLYHTCSLCEIAYPLSMNRLTQIAEKDATFDIAPYVEILRDNHLKISAMKTHISQQLTSHSGNFMHKHINHKRKCQLKKQNKKDIDSATMLSLSTIEWSDSLLGFGQLNLYVKEGQLFIDNELMSKQFIKSVFSKLIDSAQLTEPGRYTSQLFEKINQLKTKIDFWKIKLADSYTTSNQGKIKKITKKINAIQAVINTLNNDLQKELC